ncbi:MAG: WD40/YVTN/BNR-like repeat-containing protein [Chloroflexia bacterium]
MTKIYMALPAGLAVATRHEGRWETDLALTGAYTQCLASDPLHRERIYCGTFDKGLWRSADAGATWRPAGEGIPHPMVMSVAVSPVDRIGDYGAVWAGTEPSALFRSEDGGQTWQDRPALLDIPSRPTWSFPPRPHTHHVRWITPDPNDAGRLFVAIEAGGVMRSLDGGLTWEDRKPTGPYDAHTMSAPRNAPNTVCAACGDGFMAPGDGYAESHDGGESWERVGVGLGQHYLWAWRSIRRSRARCSYRRQPDLRRRTSRR